VTRRSVSSALNSPLRAERSFLYKSEESDDRDDGTARPG
jgi:hypothetical protein